AAPRDVGAAGDRGGRDQGDPRPGAGAEKRAEPGVTGWRASARTRQLATAALVALIAAIVSGHGGLVLLAAAPLAALAVLPRPRPLELPLVTVAVSGARCFEGEDVTVIATVSCPAADTTDIRFVPAATVAAAEILPGQWRINATHWGRYSPGTVLVSCVAGAWQAAVVVEAEPLEVFPRAARTRPRLVPAELLRRIGEHTGRAVGPGVEFAGLRPYVPGDSLRDVNRAVSIRRGQLHVNQRAAARAADLVVMIDALTGPGNAGPVADRALDLAVHGAAA